MTTGEAKPFLDHVQEVKHRALQCLVLVLVGAGVAYYYYHYLLILLLRPLHQPLYYSSPAGGFDLMFKVCLGAGLLLAVPAVVYHTLRFLAPLLPRATNVTLLAYVVASSGLLVTGVSFAYWLCLPAAMTFLNTFDSAQLHPLITAPEYFSFLFRYVVSFGLVAQLPIVLLLTNQVHRLPAGHLLRAGRYVILGSFILAAVLSPTPDVVNQTLLAVPMILLYYGSVGLIWGINRKYM